MYLRHDIGLLTCCQVRRIIRIESHHFCDSSTKRQIDSFVPNSKISQSIFVARFYEVGLKLKKSSNLLDILSFVNKNHLMPKTSTVKSRVLKVALRVLIFSLFDMVV